MAKILITGSKGVIGTCLGKLLKKKHDLYGLDLFHDEENTNYDRCDIKEFRQLEKYFAKYGPFDYVYHTAAEFGRWNGEDYYEQLWQTNVIGTKHLLRLQERDNFKLIYFSSSEVYGDYHDVMTEDVMRYVEIKQLNDYAMTKWVNEMQIANSAKLHKTQTVIVRLFNTYGPGEWYHSYRSVISKFCYCALHSLPIIVYKGHLRTSSYLTDVCKTLANIVSNFKAGEIYNIGNDEVHSIEELADIIWSQTKANRKLITYHDSEPLTTINKVVDISKSKRDLGHKSTTSLEDGIKNTLTWMKDYYQKSSKSKK